MELLVSHLSSALFPQVLNETMQSKIFFLFFLHFFNFSSSIKKQEDTDFIDKPKRRPYKYYLRHRNLSHNERAFNAGAGDWLDPVPFISVDPAAFHSLQFFLPWSTPGLPTFHWHLCKWASLIAVFNYLYCVLVSLTTFFMLSE
jgi:hypothetical protein